MWTDECLPVLHERHHLFRLPVVLLKVDSRQNNGALLRSYDLGQRYGRRIDTLQVCDHAVHLLVGQLDLRLVLLGHLGTPQDEGVAVVVANEAIEIIGAIRTRPTGCPW